MYTSLLQLLMSGFIIVTIPKRTLVTDYECKQLCKMHEMQSSTIGISQVVFYNHCEKMLSLLLDYNCLYYKFIYVMTQSIKYY